MILQGMDRGLDGRTLRLTTLDDEAYEQFVGGFRNFALGEMFGKAVPSMAVALAANQIDAQQTLDAEIEDIRRALDPVPQVQAWKRVMRSHQQMMWRRVVESIYRREDALKAELDAYEGKGPGKVIYDPDFVVPDYAKREIHLQPGGYVEDPLAGYVYHYGTKVFFQGLNDQDEVHEGGAALARLPKDGKVARILDIGCSVGQFATALKDRFPEAEVESIDVALPMVRYAHKRAVDLGVDVTFRQALIEDMPYPDDHFDMVGSMIVFHELPLDVTEKALKELHRVMRPGAVFSILDFPNHQGMVPPVMKFFMDFDHMENCEPYSWGFMHADFHAMLKDTGFTLETEDEPLFGFLKQSFATKV